LIKRLETVTSAINIQRTWHQQLE